jgi:hypothetical protein
MLNSDFKINYSALRWGKIIFPMNEMEDSLILTKVLFTVTSFQELFLPMTATS